jgi:hypothetical protein
MLGLIHFPASAFQQQSRTRISSIPKDSASSTNTLINMFVSRYDSPTLVYARPRSNTYSMTASPKQRLSRLSTNGFYTT